MLQAAAVTVGLAGKELTDMEALKAHGAAGFTDDGIPIMDEKLFKDSHGGSGASGSSVKLP